MTRRQTRLTGAMVAALRETCRAVGVEVPAGLGFVVDVQALHRREIELLALAHRRCAEEAGAEYALPMLAGSLDEAVLWLHNTLAVALGVQDHEMRSAGPVYRMLRAALTLAHCGLSDVADRIGDVETRVLDAARTTYYRGEDSR